MKLYSTNNPENIVDLKEAVMQSLPADKGLYMPMVIPRFEPSFFDDIESQSFQETSFLVALALLRNSVEPSDLLAMINRAITFPAPIQWLDDRLGSLELFHGPSLAFKDFGARFMSQLMAHFNQGSKSRLTILVATSGDTGGAVAAGFYNTPGIEVVILYPSGKVSDLQEKQLTTLGKNIFACEINGSFDDCQAMVKRAFLDDDLKQEYTLSSANSINIARLIPQSFYYFEAYKQAKQRGEEIVLSVPSGNFGNLTAGLMAKKMGLPITKFIAATNSNRVVPSYLENGKYHPMPSISTISNAMDVGNPSNFSRMIELYGKEWEWIKQEVVGYSYTDEETKAAMKQIKKKYDYIADPHGAVGYLALQQYLTSSPQSVGVFLETAHPAKFLSVVEPVLGEKVTLPSGLQALVGKQKKSTFLENDYKLFKEYLLERL